MKPWLAVLLVTACGGQRTGLGPLRYRNADPVTAVNDRAPVAPPGTFDTGLVEYYVREDFIEPVERALTVDAIRRAENINSLGAVPDSAWFTNRRPTPDEIRKGPGRGEPDRSAPWRVVGVKVGGAAIGITIEDANNDKFVLKFDEKGHPETESAADVIVQRLTWAMGYNVPENDVVRFEREQLVLDPKAEVKFRSGAKRAMTQADLEKYLGMAEKDGTAFRALASRLIGGKILGGVDPSGTRTGDPNDRVPHELRRDLRGQRLLWAWVNHIDLKSQNTLAVYTDEKYVKWYALDFGDSLGVNARTTGRHRLGYRTSYSIRDSMRSLVTFGLHVEPWERSLKYPALRGIGMFESKTFDPSTWKPAHSWQPTDAADRFDELWAAELIMRFTRQHIEAAVAAGSYSDPRAAAYIVRTLLERQRKIGRYAFARVAPLTAFRVRASGAALDVCFEDLWLRYGYGDRAGTAYRTRVFDYHGKVVAERGPWQPAAACMTNLPLARSNEEYTIVELELRRAGKVMAPVFVHVARGPRGPRIVGIDRR
ncbi:MAG TPA: hypothetical protein VIU61_06770 [Kofleriaceae bacterium]